MPRSADRLLTIEASYPLRGLQQNRKKGNPPGPGYVAKSEPGPFCVRGSDLRRYDSRVPPENFDSTCLLALSNAIINA